MATELPKDLETLQRAFSGHLRDPGQPVPDGIDARHLAIYRTLVRNNMASFLRTGFPVLRSVLEESLWHVLVDGFVAKHRCETPYFLEIGQEFMHYLASLDQGALPPFAQQLAHYEWLELALDIDERRLEDIEVDCTGDLISGRPMVSPLAWVQAYDYPVHRIGRDFRPEAADGPYFLLVYRDRSECVRFMEINAPTARLIALLASGTERGEQALQVLARELGHDSAAPIMGFALPLLERLRAADILLGVRP